MKGVPYMDKLTAVWCVLVSFNLFWFIWFV